MQNKPNFQAVSKMTKMSITSAITVNYINEPRTTNYELIMKNKPKQSQFRKSRPAGKESIETGCEMSGVRIGK
jgi:hypothetical protein